MSKFLHNKIKTKAIAIPLVSSENNQAKNVQHFSTMTQTMPGLQYLEVFLKISQANKSKNPYHKR